MPEEIVELGGRKLSRDDWKQIVGTGKICRLSKEQFRGWCVTADKADYAEKVWDLYASMPAGAYYVLTRNPFHEEINFQEVNRNGSPAQWISRKRFEGFTTAIPHICVYGFECFPDRSVYIPWDLTVQQPYVRLRKSSSLSCEDLMLDEQELRNMIDRNYIQWQRFFWKVKSEEFRDDVKNLREQWKFSLKELSHARRREYKTWEDVYLHLLEDIRTPVGFKIDKIHPIDYDGYEPEVSEVHSPEEISNFIIRFLSFKDNGRVLPAKVVA